jgi:hypothetical protein
MPSVRGLLTQALYKSVFDRQLQPAIPPDYMTAAWLDFNMLLDELRDKIPYTFSYRFTDVNLLQNTLFVQIDDVRYVLAREKYNLRRLMLSEYEDQSFLEGLDGFPQVYWFDESTQTIEVYPLPSQPDYTFLVHGRKALGPLEIDDELPSNMPVFIQSYIIYETAFRQAAVNYGIAWSPEKEMKRKSLESQMNGKIVVDLRPPTQSIFGNDGSLPFPFLFWDTTNGI